jgi:hypothetical protein
LIVILAGDIFDDGSIIKNRYSWVGLSRSKSNDGTDGSIRKRAHWMSELLCAETSGNWVQTTVNVSWTKHRHELWWWL